VREQRSEGKRHGKHQRDEVAHPLYGERRRRNPQQQKSRDVGKQPGHCASVAAQTFIADEGDHPCRPDGSGKQQHPQRRAFKPVDIVFKTLHGLPPPWIMQPHLLRPGERMVAAECVHRHQQAILIRVLRVGQPNPALFKGDIRRNIGFRMADATAYPRQIVVMQILVLCGIPCIAFDSISRP
jgi:hypothetical protein